MWSCWQNRQNKFLISDFFCFLWIDGLIFGLVKRGLCQQNQDTFQIVSCFQLVNGLLFGKSPAAVHQRNLAPFFPSCLVVVLINQAPTSIKQGKSLNLKFLEYHFAGYPIPQKNIHGRKKDTKLLSEKNQLKLSSFSHYLFTFIGKILVSLVTILKGGRYNHGRLKFTRFKMLQLLV